MIGWYYDGETPIETTDLFENTSGADFVLRHPTSDVPGAPSSWGAYCLKFGGPSTAQAQIAFSTNMGMVDAFTAEMDFTQSGGVAHGWYTFPFAIYSQGFFANELWLRHGYYGSSEHLQVATGYYTDSYEQWDITTAFVSTNFNHIKMSITSTPTPHLRVWLNSTLALDTTLADQFWSSPGTSTDVVPEANLAYFCAFMGTGADYFFDNVRIVPYEATSDPTHLTSDCRNMVALGTL